MSQLPEINEVVVLAKEAIDGQKSLVAYLVPDLDKLRVPYEERCLIAINENEFIFPYMVGYDLKLGMIR